jgi:ribosomal protein S18 acetylase RimI-like enzyme
MPRRGRVSTRAAGLCDAVVPPAHAPSTPATACQGRVARGALRLRPYEPADAGRVVQLVADVLERLYPTGGEWLERKQRSFEREGARCTLAEVGSTLLGLTIESVKGLGRCKLSTIWVNEPARGRGIGTALLDSCLVGWRRELLNEAYVTVSLQVVGVVALLLVPKGFQLRALERDRYGAGRDEVVLAWSRAGQVASADRGWVNEQLGQIRSLPGA